MEPPFAGYKRTKAALAHYFELGRQDDGEQLPVPAFFDDIYGLDASLQRAPAKGYPYPG